MTDEWQAPHTHDAPPAVELPPPPSRVIDLATHPLRGASTAAGPPSRLDNAKRSFLRRAVEYLSVELGIRHFIDVGSRLPVADGIHGIVRSHAAGAHVVYVDTATAAPLYDRSPSQLDGLSVVAGDPAPHALVDTLIARGHIDLDTPVAVLMIEPAAVGGAGRTRALAQALHAATAPGSHVVLAADDTTADIFTPFTLLAPGVADMAWWPYPDEEVSATGTGVSVGMARR
ncbi:SAM-dependent methyltransferase [Salinactinospora qingdaonensis]|uniref:S-adenosyl methyltransferase n=1 Tax=Salinactinospora qingdaonensis TaxID=702744 RepID=A0ABP7FD20_9ACTN